jgi:hypothetical protein
VVDYYAPLLNPKKEPAAWVMGTIDVCSWALPSLSAVLAIIGGCSALENADRWAAFFGIAGGVTGALGVLATNWSSRVRDHRIEWVKSLAGLGVDMGQSAQRYLE